MKKKVTMDASKMMGILINMIEQSWKNEIVMIQAILDMTNLYRNMTLTADEYRAFKRISDTLQDLKPVTWDEYLKAWKEQAEKKELKTTELDKLIAELGCNYGD